mgnify:CR=1 FL=1
MAMTMHVSILIRTVRHRLVPRIHHSVPFEREEKGKEKEGEGKKRGPEVEARGRRFSALLVFSRPSFAKTIMVSSSFQWLLVAAACNQNRPLTQSTGSTYIRGVDQ